MTKNLPLSDEQLREWVMHSLEAQGLAVTVEDIGVLKKINGLLGREIADD